MTVQLNLEEFAEQVEAIFEHVREVAEETTDTVASDLQLDVQLNILTGYVTLGWDETSPSYREWRENVKGLPPITQGHTLDEQLLNSVFKQIQADEVHTLAIIFIPKLDPREYEVYQEFGWTSRSGRDIPARPFFQPAIDDLAPIFEEKLVEIFERLS